MHFKNQRNFGFGKQVGFALKRIVRSRLGEGQFLTQRDNRSRLKHLQTYMKANGIRSLELLTPHDMRAFEDFICQRVTEGELSQKYAKNIISDVSTTLCFGRGDLLLYMSPSKKLGRSSSIKERPPLAMDREVVLRAVERMEDQGFRRMGLAIGLQRSLGLRTRESAVMRISRAVREARSQGRTNVIDGTKGGRKSPRWVKVDSDAMSLLERAAACMSQTGCLIDDGLTFRQWDQRLRYRYRKVSADLGLSSKLHDLRASFACEQYEVMTGHPPPVINGSRVASKDADRRAREELAYLLGHNRADVVASYVGSSR